MSEHIQVTVIEQNKTRVFQANAGDALKDLFIKWGISIPMPCGGNGRCGKCKVILRGQGGVLLCSATVSADCIVEVPKILSSEEDIVAETVPDSSFAGEGKEKMAVAVDIGTTTIVAAVIEGDSVRSSACVNHQRSFGGDVISRIQAASDPEVAEALKNSVREDISSLIKELVPVKRRSELEALVITGNTTMLHLLTGKDVSGLGSYPYTPVSLDFEELKGSADAESLVPGAGDNLRVILMPGISAFVGADIVSGLYFLLQDKGKKDALFIDLGTNGEMACVRDGGIRVTSTAAGPVFEGGQISCGTASVPGAVCHVEISDTKPPRVNYKTIGGAPAIGICGTGALELVSELVRCEIIDETGLLADEYFEEGFPVTEDGKVRFLQQDIRAVQMGKAAILAGIRAITEGASPEAVYVAGGFGSASDPSKFWNLNIFPGDFDGKIEIVGNTALKGAISFAKAVLTGPEKEAEARDKIQSILEDAELVELATQDDFGEEYINSMNF